jgi:membrane-associated HD superfamily phosphohydrolase
MIIYRRINNILGENYLRSLKILVNNKYRIVPKYFIIKYLLFLLNILFSSNLCILVFNIINGFSINQYYGFGDFLVITTLGFVFSILPQIILYILLYFINKEIKINKIIEIVFVIINGFFMTVVTGFLLAPNLYSRAGDYFREGHYIYIPIIVSGIIFRILLYIIDKINIRKK